MNYVIDCSTALKWVVAEVDSPSAIRLRDDFRKGLHVLLAPDLFPTEVANALLITERRKRIAIGEGAVFLADVLNTLPRLHDATPLLPRAYAIAHRYQASAYDCLYVALAEREQCEFVTADSRLINNLQTKFPFIVSLASLP
jgi:predicted nucleic acid-binding protein